jgi:CDP-diacylglycerol--serine O-phosphatidyltransferase
MNMFCGFLSIINSNERQFIFAAWLIFIAAVFDALDGMVARLTKSSSALGVQLDSLSDLVSFGVAPSFLIYMTYMNQFQSAALGIIISSFLMLAGGFRLARFNVQLVGFDKDYFRGVPIPLQAITIASFVLVYYRDNKFPEYLQPYIISLVIILSLLMVSTIKYDTLPKFSKAGLRQKPYHFVFAAIAAAALALTQGKALFFLFILIIGFGIIRHVYYYFKTGITKKG